MQAAVENAQAWRKSFDGASGRKRKLNTASGAKAKLAAIPKPKSCIPGNVPVSSETLRGPVQRAGADPPSVATNNQ